MRTTKRRSNKKSSKKTRSTQKDICQNENNHSSPYRETDEGELESRFLQNINSDGWEDDDDDDSDLQPPAVLDLLDRKRTELALQYGKAYDDFLNISDKEKKNVAFEMMENVASKYVMASLRIRQISTYGFDQIIHKRL
ncbi:hypothetical protein HK104_000106 [Borealophlyctis nickersoniae]|nr:hypothetical protein HK104_000106 [Borealophlyctis nickersoniae]